jgi:hypothetical protein
MDSDDPEQIIAQITFDQIEAPKIRLEELQGRIRVSPEDTNPQIIDKIKLVLSGGYNPAFKAEGRRKLPSRAVALGLKIVSKGGFTCKEMRKTDGEPQHTWAAKDDLNRYIPVDGSEKAEGNSVRYQFDFDAIRKIGKVLRDAELRDLLSERDRASIIKYHKSACAFCAHVGTKLQVDHPVPFRLGGNIKSKDPTGYLVVCAPCNRRKDKSCVDCPNMNGVRDPTTCSRCYWASPNDYDHIETKPYKQVLVMFTTDEEIQILKKVMGRLKGESLAALIKSNFLSSV